MTVGAIRAVLAARLPQMEDDLVAWGRVVRLETRGRVSGRTATAVVGYVERPDGSLWVATGSPDADWGLNLLADPACRVTLGDASFAGIARQLEPAEHAGGDPGADPALRDAGRGPRRGTLVRDPPDRVGSRRWTTPPRRPPSASCAAPRSCRAPSSSSSGSRSPAACSRWLTFSALAAIVARRAQLWLLARSARVGGPRDHDRRVRPDPGRDGRRGRGVDRRGRLPPGRGLEPGRVVGQDGPGHLGERSPASRPGPCRRSSRRRRSGSRAASCRRSRPRSRPARCRS